MQLNTRVFLSSMSKSYPLEPIPVGWKFATLLSYQKVFIDLKSLFKVYSKSHPNSNLQTILFCYYLQIYCHFFKWCMLNGTEVNFPYYTIQCKNTIPTFATLLISSGNESHGQPSWSRGQRSSYNVWYSFYKCYTQQHTYDMVSTTTEWLRNNVDTLKSF